MLMYQKSLFDRYYCIKTFSRSKTLEKIPRKLSCTYYGAERQVTCQRFKNATSKANTNVMLASRNYVCYCARYCWAPREVLKTEDFNTSLGTQQMLMYQKIIYRYYCIKHFVSLENRGEIASKSFFTCTYNGAKKHVTCKRFENVASRAIA